MNFYVMDIHADNKMMCHFRDIETALVIVMYTWKMKLYEYGCFGI